MNPDAVQASAKDAEFNAGRIPQGLKPRVLLLSFRPG
jgi:hypothetical protein